MIMKRDSRGDPWNNAIPRVTVPLEHAKHDAAVCLLLRWARDTRRDVVVVGELCDALGLDLGAALRRWPSRH